MTCNYFPFLRGKQHELMALRGLAASIADSGRVIPIIEPVNANRTTQISIDRFIEASTLFLFVCNPTHGTFSDDAVGLREKLIDQELIDYDRWVPSLYVGEQTTVEELESFINAYDDYLLALIYSGRPRNAVREMIEENRFEWQVFIDRPVESEYIESVPTTSRVFVSDRFHRQPRNADYPAREFFTDLNTAAGNPQGRHFGDFSIVGDQYTEAGGPAYAVALHHIHYSENSGSLDISHFISDRVDTSADAPGKIIEALTHLVNALDTLQPNNTKACQEYREMNCTQQSRGLGYMKRLAIAHHIETMLGNGLDG